MALKLTLRPGEKLLLGPAVLQCVEQTAKVLVLNKVPIVRDKDIITEEEADTPAKKLYATILKMYLDQEHERKYHEAYFHLLRQLIAMNVETKALNLLMDVSERIIEGDHYRALKACRKLVDYEARVLNDEHG